MKKSGEVFRKTGYAFIFAMILFVVSFEPAVCQTIASGHEQASVMAGRKLNLMPLPASVIRNHGKFRLDSTFTIAVKGNPGHRIFPYASRVLRRLSNRTGLFFKQDYVTPKASVDSANLIIKIGHPIKLHLGMDESYHLVVSHSHITLTSNTDVGALRGLETFLQLLKANRKGYYFPAVNIHDHPRFKWRGLMIDCSRHFMPVSVIKRNLDGMAVMKLNVFHWHLSDYQGFRAQSKVFPKLTKDGSDGHFYTQGQIKEIIRYANQRGIRVVPEFDMPGHATSWFVGYPKLASAPGPYKIQRQFGVFNPAMNPVKPYTYTFLSKFLKEMTDLFPDKYFHIGGDEVNGKQWDANPNIQAFMKKHGIENDKQLQAYFNRHVLKMLTRDHKKMIGWGETLQPGMPHDIVIQSWRGTKVMVEAAKKGYQSILSNGYYLDLVQPTDVLYLNNPLPPGLGLTQKQKKRILGGEATMWSEFVTPQTIDSRIWPRMAAVAEDLWSIHAPDIKLPNGYMTSVPDSLMTTKIRFEIHDMYRRLGIISNQLEQLGLRFKSNYPVMLRNLANSDNILALRTFVNVVSPVELYKRPNSRPYTQYSPFTRVVDAARPDPETVRHFRFLVNGYLRNHEASADTLHRIESWLRLWEINNIPLQKTIDHSPILDEIAPLSKYLSQISDIGLKALSYLHSKQRADKEWINNSLKILKNAAKPRGQVAIRVVKPIKKLVLAAGTNSTNFKLSGKSTSK